MRTLRTDRTRSTSTTRTFRTTVVAAAALAALSGASAEAAESRLGVVEFNRQDDIFADGGRWLRVLMEWQYIEPADDEYAWNNGFTAWLEEAESVGHRLSPVIAIGKTWASGHEGEEATWPSHPPLDLLDTWDDEVGYSVSYYDYVQNLMFQYGSRIDRLSVENEVNTREFWRGTMDDYRKILATTRKAIDDWAPGILLFDSGLGSGSWGAAVGQWMMESGEFTDTEVLDFVNDYYANNVYATFFWPTIEEFRYWVRQPFVQENNKRVEYILSIAGDYCDGLNFKFTELAHLLPPVIAWMDDLLAANGTPLPLKVNNEASNWPLGSQVLEAQNMFKMVIVGLSEGVEQTIWFPYSNFDVPTPRTGLRDDSDNDTIQAATYFTLNSHLGTWFSYDSKDVLSGDVLRYRFKRDDRPEPTMDALWWDNGNHGSGSRTVSIPVPAGTQRVNHVLYDGTTELLDVVGGEVTVTITEAGHMLKYMETVTDTEEAPDVTGVSLTHRPNPFRPQTTVGFTLDAAGPAIVAIYDAGGRLVAELANSEFDAGRHSVTWDGTTSDGSSVAAGTYFTRVTTANGVISGQVTRLR